MSDDAGVRRKLNNKWVGVTLLICGTALAVTGGVMNAKYKRSRPSQLTQPTLAPVPVALVAPPAVSQTAPQKPRQSSIIGKYDRETDGLSSEVVTAEEASDISFQSAVQGGLYDIRTTEYKVRQDSGTICSEVNRGDACFSDHAHGMQFILVCINSEIEGKNDGACEDLVPGQTYLLGERWTPHRDELTLNTGYRRSYYQLWKLCATEGQYAGRCQYKDSLDDFSYYRTKTPSLANEAPND